MHPPAVAAVAADFESNHSYVEPYPGDLQTGSVYPRGDWVPRADGVSRPGPPHGAAAYFGWTQTNSFLRFFSLVYNVAYIMGEPKHGLWNYVVPGATLPFYWCDMGLSLSPATEKSKAAGLGDYPPQQSGMEDFWRAVHKGFDPRDRSAKQAGPLAKAAKLESVAVDIVRMELSKGASLWKNVGSGKAPRFERASRAGDATEYYIVTAYYPDKPMYFREKKKATKGSSTTRRARRVLYSSSDAGALALHSFVVAVPSAAVLDGISPGVPSYGIHFDASTACPDKCGSAKCICDHLLLDLRLEGNLGPTWTSPDFGVPLGLVDGAEPKAVPKAVPSRTVASSFPPTTERKCQYARFRYLPQHTLLYVVSSHQATKARARLRPFPLSHYKQTIIIYQRMLTNPNPRSTRTPISLRTCTHRPSHVARSRLQC